MKTPHHHSLRSHQAAKLLIVWSMLSSCTHGQLSTPSPDTTVQDTISIYTAVIDDLYIVPRRQYGHPIKQLVMSNTTENLSNGPMNTGFGTMIGAWQAMRQRIPNVPSELFKKFRATNATTTTISRFTLDSIPVLLVADTTLKRIFDSYVPNPSPTWEQVLKDTLRMWAPFYQNYPHAQGILSLSRITLDRTHQWALIYVQNVAGGLSGSGYLVLLQRSGQNWQVRSEIGLWEA